jgi:hypothetical protein
VFRRLVKVIIGNIPFMVEHSHAGHVTCPFVEYTALSIPSRFQVGGVTIMASSESPVPAARISFASLTHQNIGTVRKLNSVLFPVRYSDKYYQDILQPEIEAFCQLGPSLR